MGTWAKAARQNGLRFGVTVHCARSWDWYDVAHGADKSGPLAGVPYDGILTEGRRPGQVVGRLRPGRTLRPARRRADGGGPPGLHRQVVQPHPRPDRQVRSRLALFRRRHESPGRGGHEHLRPLLQCQHPAARRKDRSRAEHQGHAQSMLEVPRPRLRAGPQQPRRKVSLANRHLHRRMALSSGHRLSQREGSGHGTGRDREQEWQSAAEYPRAGRWHHRRPGSEVPRKA